MSAKKIRFTVFICIITLALGLILHAVWANTALKTTEDNSITLIGIDYPN